LRGREEKGRLCGGRFRRLWLLLFLAVLISISLIPAIPAQGQEEPEISTGPIDPAAGSWITYRGERSVPDQPAPQAFSLRISYTFPPDAPAEDMSIDATATEHDAQGKEASVRTFRIQTLDRFFRSSDGADEGWWTYWLTPGLNKDDKATVGTGTNLTAEEIQDFEYKGNRFKVVKLRGDGLELLAEQHTGLVFRIAKDGGENLQIEDTNMLAQYLSWGYSPDYAAVGSRLKSLADEYPNLVEVSSLGKSAKGREIWMAHITDFTSSESKSAVLIDACLEGDAPEGSAFILDFLDELVQTARDDDTKSALLDRMSIYFVPLVNPDGLQRWLAMPDPGESPELESQAPRNARLVNINRNFNVKWEEGSGNPASADYAGPVPFSETESQALRKLFDDIPVNLYINLHSGNDFLNTPWNWSEQPSFNPEMEFYENILAELMGNLPFPARVGGPKPPFTGSSTDWAYEGNGASSPICFDLYLRRFEDMEIQESVETADEAAREQSVVLFSYAPQRYIIFHLMENLQSYLAVDIVTSDLRVEVNVPIDVKVQITVSGKRALPNARARLILPDESGLKFAALTEKEVDLGDLQPGSSVEVTWNLEGKTSGSNIAEVILTSSYPEYDRIPGTYEAKVEISVSTQRTWLVLVLLTIMVLLVLGMILLSMRKHRKAAKS
jgi:hypothetical protein